MSVMIAEPTDPVDVIVALPKITALDLAELLASMAREDNLETVLDQLVERLKRARLESEGRDLAGAYKLRDAVERLTREKSRSTLVAMAKRIIETGRAGFRV